jgi:hypothetical protein
MAKQQAAFVTRLESRGFVFLLAAQTAASQIKRTSGHF